MEHKTGGLLIKWDQKSRPVPGTPDVARICSAMLGVRAHSGLHGLVYAGPSTYIHE
ncbi:MAG: hypothetical protein JNM27_00315 [Leptospirales bacterium]|nr:hypothetical protein [Leptospirales bacterium]